MSNCFDPRHCKVALLAGGTSGEREVSLASGEGAYNALEEAGFSVTVLDPAKKEDLKQLIDDSFDVAFLCLHGRCGEDGTMQGLLEVIGIPYTGSGVWSSALAMDKAKAKLYYEKEGILTPESMTLRADTPFDPKYVMQILGSPCVVKPDTEGSALGVFIVDEEEELAQAVSKAFEFDEEVLIEHYVKGTELTVAVIGNDELEALPIIEIVPKSDFYDYESKYAPGGSKHLCPAPLDEEVAANVKNLAKKAHRALSCSGMSRSDFILDDEGRCWILETNTIPGMTKTSLLPDAACAAGVSFPQLCTKLVQLALSRNGRSSTGC